MKISVNNCTAYLGIAIASALLSARGAEYYVAPNGTASGPGTTNQPYALATALSGAVGRAGDTFWLRGGNYTLGHFETKIQGAAGQPITFRQMPGERAKVDGSITFWSSTGNVILWGFELYSSDQKRVSSQSGAGFRPTDLTIHTGIDCYVPNMKFINMLVHDHVGQGIYLSGETANTVVHGCLVYNNGWHSVDNGDGHNLYIQNSSGTKVISDNVAFNDCMVNFHVYDNHSGANLVGITLDGNVAFNAGALTPPTIRTSRDWIVGVDSPGILANGIVFKNNMGYYAPGSATIPIARIGQQGVNGNLTLTGNYLPLGLLLNNWQTMTATNNFICPRTSDYIVDLNQNLTALSAGWDKNTYVRPSTGKDFRRTGSAYSFSTWKTTTGYDTGSGHSIADPSGTRVFVRTNQYEPGRANLVVYNWDRLNTVPVNIGSLLAPGTRYEVRNAQDFNAAPVLTGTYSGAPLQLPMTGLSVARPNGTLVAPPATGPEFNVFVLLPLTSVTSSNTGPNLNIAKSGNNVRLAWPANAGNFSVQYRDAKAGTSVWSNLPAVPVLVSNYNVIDIVGPTSPKLFRLKSS